MRVLLAIWLIKYVIVCNNHMNEEFDVPVLCVDLDGTLIFTDSLQESILMFIKKNLLHVFLVLYWLCWGRAYLKQQMALHVDMDPALLPYNTALLDWLSECKRRGQKIVLATAMDWRYAEKIATYLGIFDQVLASDGKKNLRSKQKAALLNQLFGQKGYDYAGNSPPDLAVWQDAHAAVVVNASQHLLRITQQRFKIRKIFLRPKMSLKLFLSTLRAYRYTENMLIFLPLVVGCHWMDASVLSQTVLGFICFCLMSSALYLMDDLLNIPATRKQFPCFIHAIASGYFPISDALLLVGLFFGGTLALACYVLPSSFLVVLGLYAGLLLSYLSQSNPVLRQTSAKKQTAQRVVKGSLLLLLYLMRIIGGLSLGVKG